MPTNNRTDYNDLYTRNWPMIPREVQAKISQLKIAVAGCGSTGGAFIEGAIRAGVQNFHLCDNGSYELSNLNRQMMTQSEIGLNKAEAYSRKVKAINTSAITKVWDQGLSPNNVGAFLEGVDFLFDAVDVTTESGMSMKLRLHEMAAQKKIPTGSALDLGFTQWLQSYNYHLGDVVLHGHLENARQAKHPLKALLLGFSPIESLPLEISDELIRLIKDPKTNACQLACVCFLLSAMVTPYLTHFVKVGKLPPLTEIDLTKYFETDEERKKRLELTKKSHITLRNLMELTT